MGLDALHAHPAWLTCLVVLSGIRVRCQSQSPSDTCCSGGAAVAGLKDILRMRLAGHLGAAAVEGAEGLLISQKPLPGRWAPGRACSLLLAGSDWQKARIPGRLMPICASRRSCRHSLGQVLVQGFSKHSDVQLSGRTDTMQRKTYSGCC